VYLSHFTTQTILFPQSEPRSKQDGACLLAALASRVPGHDKSPGAGGIGFFLLGPTIGVSLERKTVAKCFRSGRSLRLLMLTEVKVP
jgi:hypothetical protein